MINMEHYIIISQFEKKCQKGSDYLLHTVELQMLGKKMKANYLGSTLRSVFIINYKNTDVFL